LDLVEEELDLASVSRHETKIYLTFMHLEETRREKTSSGQS
jgi:hypothetical protein